VILQIQGAHGFSRFRGTHRESEAAQVVKQMAPARQVASDSMQVEFPAFESQQVVQQRQPKHCKTSAPTELP